MPQRVNQSRRPSIERCTVDSWDVDPSAMILQLGALMARVQEGEDLDVRAEEKSIRERMVREKQERLGDPDDLYLQSLVDYRIGLSTRDDLSRSVRAREIAWVTDELLRVGAADRPFQTDELDRQLASITELVGRPGFRSGPLKDSLDARIAALSDCRAELHALVEGGTAR